MAVAALVDDVKKRSDYDDAHVLVIPFPARDHNLAMIQLAQKLLPYGVRITLDNIFDDLSPELPYVCRTVNIAVGNLGVRPAHHGSGNLPFFGDVESVKDETEQLVASIASEIDSLLITCIVSDIFLGWTQFKIPRYVVCASPARILAALLYMPALAAQMVVPVQPSEKAELVHIPDFSPTRRGDLSPIVQTLSPICNSLFRAVRSPVLPTRRKSRQPVDSVLYVNFGSIVSRSIRQIHELALGLQTSKQRFLLVVRPSTVESHEDLPLLPKSFTAHTLEMGFVQSEWVNQLDVLSHPAVGGFPTHCGWNSTFESLCRGVPLLAWPFQAGQMLNCRFLVDDAKTAVEVRKGANGFVSGEEVARSVGELMTEPEEVAVKENVRKLRDKVKQAVSEDWSVRESVDQFLAELKKVETSLRAKDGSQSSNAKKSKMQCGRDTLLKLNTELSVRQWQRW